MLKENSRRHFLTSGACLIKSTKRPRFLVAGKSASEKALFSARRPAQISPARRRLKQVIGGGLGLGVILWGLAYFLETYLVVDEVSCTLNRGAQVCPRELAQAGMILVGRPLLFYNFQPELEALKSPGVNFSDFSYQKVLPGKLALDFVFAPALYQLTVDSENFFAFDQHGQYTLATSGEGLLQITIEEATILQDLTTYTLNPVMHQKFFDLEYLSALTRESWQKIVLQDLNTLAITTAKATYLIDPFTLDENLQKLDFLETNWLPAGDERLTVDLRLRLPVLKKS